MNPHELIDAHLDGGLTAEQFDALRAWILADRENARLFARLSLIDRTIFESMKGEDIAEFMLFTPDSADESMLMEAVEAERQAAARRAEQEAAQQTARDDEARDRRDSLQMLFGQSQDVVPVRHIVIPRSLAYGVTAALAAMVMLAVYLGWSGRRAAAPPPPRPIVAQIIDAVDAKWRENLDVHAGVTLRAGETATLERGFVKLRFNNNAEVILEAPVTIEPISDRELMLARGRLVGHCPPGAEGFTVVTAKARIVDLGTQFGVECNADGQTTVGVMDGRVSLDLPDTAQGDRPREMAAGAIVRVDRNGSTVRDLAATQFDRFHGNWEHIMRPIRVRGSVRVVDLPPAQLVEDNDIIHVYRERMSVLLSEPLTVSRTATGLYEPREIEHATLPAGTCVDSYLVHFDRLEAADEVEQRFELTFAQPVIGLIVNRDLLRDTDASLGAQGTNYPTVPMRGIDDENPKLSDSLELSPDRLTLKVTLRTADLDHFRVLTEAPAGEK